MALHRRDRARGTEVRGCDFLRSHPFAKANQIFGSPCLSTTAAAHFFILYISEGNEAKEGAAVWDNEAKEGAAV